MTSSEMQARLDEVDRNFAWANCLGVRAVVCGDRAQLEEARRIHAEASAELEILSAINAAEVAELRTELLMLYVKRRAREQR